MTREEAHIFLDNLKVCIEEHPIVADWLVEIADRKTEPSTKCKMCKHFKDRPNCGWECEYDTFEECKYEPKDEPQKIGYCNECEWFGNKQVCGRCRSKNLFAPKTEPQTERSE